jgi:branched-chain amino acid transport system permease protein
MLDFLQVVVDGLLFGATYALIGIGFTLVFGVMHKINMAYAAASIGGAYCGLLILKVMAGAPAWLVFLCSFFAGGVLGYLVYVTCFHFIPYSSPLATLMSTVGMLLLIDEIVVHATEGRPLNYPAVFDDVMLRAGDFSLRGDLLLVFAVSVACMAALLALLYKTKLGLATRAVAQQPTAAQLCGIRIAQVNAVTFVVTGLLGGIAGALIGASVGTLSPLLTLPLTVKGLIVTVIGGLGSVPGAIVAGLLVGAFENVFQLWRGVTERDLYVMLLLFVFLVFRPGGLFSKS